MIFRDLIQTGIRSANANAPAILTAFGAVGVVSTAILAAHASFGAVTALAEAHEDKAHADGYDEDVHDYDDYALTKGETFKIVAPFYIGTVVSGTLACASIVMAHRVSSKRALALAAAYAMSEGRLEEYQEKVKEKLGISKEAEIRDEIVQEKVTKDFQNHDEVVWSPISGKVLIREDYTGRYFWTTVEQVNKAVNDVNHKINAEGSRRMSDFYDLLGWAHTTTSDYMGWNRSQQLALDWNTSVSPDGTQAVHTFDYSDRPILDPELGDDSFR